MSLEQNLKSVLSVIDHSKSRSAFDGEIKLIAVSKFQSINKIKELYALGHRRFGENYLQELEEKSEKLPDDIEWHFIGAIQSKKIKKIVGRVDYIHSVESIKHLEKIESVCIEQNLTQNVLLQVNIAQEESKSGFSVGKIGEVIRFANELKATTVVGLMAMPPLVGNAEANREYFKLMSALLTQCRTFYRSPERMIELSMGTSSDFSVAIEEGATFVRVGSELMGPRDSSNEGQQEDN